MMDQLQSHYGCELNYLGKDKTGAYQLLNVHTQTHAHTVDTAVLHKHMNKLQEIKLIASVAANTVLFRQREEKK